MNPEAKRILIVDDNEAIHEDFKQILAPAPIDRDKEMETLEKDLFSISPEYRRENEALRYQIEDAFQGDEAVQMVKNAEKEGWQYSLIFMDVRMPPGIDGIQAIEKIWAEFPHIEFVICTAFSDYTWDEIVRRCGGMDHLFFMKKPFDEMQVKQVAAALTSKWNIAKKNRKRIRELELEVENRNHELREMISHLSALKNNESMIMTRGDFIPAVTQKIYSPLHGIMGMTDLLLDTELNMEQKEYADTIRKSSDYLLIIVDELLDFLRIARHKVQRRDIEFDIATSTNAALELFSLCAEEKALDIYTVLDASVPRRTSGDAGFLRGVLLLLMSEAMELNGIQRIRLSITREPGVIEESPTGRITLRFTLTIMGPLNAAADSVRRFSQFLPNDTTQDERGKLNGILLAKELIRGLGGKAGICTPGGDGFSFWFTAAFSSFQMDAAYLALSPEDINDMYVLLLGDNLITRRILSIYINHWGGKCMMASTVGEAVERLQGTVNTIPPQNIVIVDYRDKTMEDFVASALEIHKHKDFSNISMVCIPSNVERGDADVARKCGYTAYLTKPIKQSHLFGCISLIKAGRRSGPRQNRTPDFITKHIVDEICDSRFNALCAGELDEFDDFAKELYRIGIRCEIAGNTKLAIAALSSKHYDIAFVYLPSEQDLGEIAAALRANNVPIGWLLREGRSMPDDGLVERLGVRGVLTAPFNTSSVRTFCEKHLAGAGSKSFS